MKQTATIETITPRTAQAYLDANTTRNRPISDNRVLSLAIDIEEGRFVCNGETIIFNSSGDILDGHHRLRAVVLARKSIKTHVVRGVDSDIFVTIDSQSRSCGDVLHINDVPNAGYVAATCNQVYRLQTGNVASRKSLNNSQIIDFYNKNLGVLDSLRVCYKVKRVTPVTVMAGCHYMFAKKSKEEADLFVERLATGAELSETDAVYHLRETLMRDAAKRHERMSAAYRIALTIKAWNATRDQQEVRALRWAANEKFPRIQ